MRRPDVIWAAMSLHHIADAGALLRSAAAALGSEGVLAIVEMAGLPRFAPDDDAGLRVLEDRCHAAAARAGWEALAGSRPTTIGDAGLEIVRDRTIRVARGADPAAPGGPIRRALVLAVPSPARRARRDALARRRCRAARYAHRPGAGLVAASSNRPPTRRGTPGLDRAADPGRRRCRIARGTPIGRSVALQPAARCSPLLRKALQHGGGRRETQSCGAGLDEFRGGLAVRMPPLALTPMCGLTAPRMTRTASTLAPPAGWKPVEVFTMPAPACSARRHTSATMSGPPRSSSTADSMMTLSRAESPIASRTVRMSENTSS